MDLDKLKKDIFNMTNRVGVYYVAETEPVPADGYKDFYENLRAYVNYPESAKDQGIEGTVYVKFVVNDEGKVSDVIASEAIESDSDWIVESMVKEAKNAVKESGDHCLVW
ncbi:MAG: TonB family protein [Cyclobacteriaceae bacterium]